MKTLILFLISFFSNLFKSMGLRACRFYPTCSEYCKEAFGHHRFTKAFLLSVSRLLRCQPFSLGGFDPVPTSPFVNKGKF